MFCQLFIEILLDVVLCVRSLLCLGLSLGCLLAQSHSTADQREGLYHLPDYVVTASRVPQSIDQLSPSVSLISTQD